MAKSKVKKVKTDWGNFTLHSADKVTRVIEGTMNSKGEILDGLGLDAKDNDILVQYDKLNGLIRGKENAKIKSGCFWDSRKKEPFKKPEVIFIFRFGNKLIEVPADKELPLEVRAWQQAEKGSAKESEKIAEKDSVIEDLKKQVAELARLVKASQKEEPKKEEPKKEVEVKKTK